mgnify:CR=1 FL=1
MEFGKLFELVIAASLINNFVSEVMLQYFNVDMSDKIL